MLPQAQNLRRDLSPFPDVLVTQTEESSNSRLPISRAMTAKIPN
jgi:hypothetical protein